MALPALTQHGLLPEGVYDCSMEELRRLFAAATSSQRRRELFGKLEEFLQALRAAGRDAQLIVDGSFVMRNVAHPNDVDVVLVLPNDWDVTAEVRPFEYDLISSRRARRRFGIDVYAVPSGSAAERNWTRFFGGVRREWVHEFGLPDGTRKGLPRVRP